MDIAELTGRICSIGVYPSAKLIYITIYAEDFEATESGEKVSILLPKNTQNLLVISDLLKFQISHVKFTIIKSSKKKKTTNFGEIIDQFNATRIELICERSKLIQ